MAIIQIEIPDEEHKRFCQQAEQDGVTRSEWMTAVAIKQCNERKVQKELRVHEPLVSSKPFESEAEIREFFRLCDELTAEEGPEREPDWQEHKKLILEGMMSGWTGT